MPQELEEAGQGVLPRRLSKDCSPPTPDEASETPSDPQRGREKQRSGRESKRIELNVEKQGAKARRRGRCAGRRAGGRREGGWVFVASLQRALCPEPPDPDGPLRGVNAPTAGMRKCRLWVSKSLGEDANEAQAGKQGAAGTGLQAARTRLRSRPLLIGRSPHLYFPKLQHKQKANIAVHPGPLTRLRAPPSLPCIVAAHT